jgi:LmbE family N-acetylglucosaminyl deacetylase
MKRLPWVFFALLGVWSQSRAQTAKVVTGADERFKADIMVVVAHPDDEGAVTPYLARAIYDLHKRVAVVYGTHGGSGANNIGREHAGALEDIREMEAREACARLGITNVWFLDGKDTASQNVLNSLANWGHGANLEKLVQLVRLTRPEVMISSLPSIFIGENHGDHQAAGVLATEAFDLAGDPTVFPEQLAGSSPKRELYLENLLPWQVKKIFYFADARDDKQFAGSGPAYSILEVSAAQKKPYWRLAIDAAMTHLTQYPEEIHALSKLNEAEIEKEMTSADTGWWTNPETLIFGKSAVGGRPTGDVFEGIETGIPVARSKMASPPADDAPKREELSLGGPWAFYEGFRVVHGLTGLPVAKIPEIGVKAGGPVYVPLTVRHGSNEGLTVKVEAAVPQGWKVTGGQGEFLLPSESSTELRVEIETPLETDAKLKEAQAQEITVRAEVKGKSIGEVRLRVLLQTGGLPQ